MAMCLKDARDDAVIGRRHAIEAFVTCIFEECSNTDRAVKSLHEEEEYADLTIECGGRTYRVHKAIVCGQSDWFQAACRKDTFKEGRESTIVLKTSSDPAEDQTGLDDPEAIRHMVHYLYHGDYNNFPKRNKEGDKVTTLEADRTLATSASVFATAIKYGIEDLRHLASAYYSEIACGPKIKQQVINVEDIAQAIRTAHSAIPPDVKDLREATSKMLLGHPTLIHDERVTAAIEETPRAAFELLLESHNLQQQVAKR
ncbi:hypothetical protein LTR56_012291 [Elasticomyces elasticus]|nr:hypothetical protein LTR22_021056 [Elasticomyces elasticus]KAK3639714.1 hypothetical protein LTR56_012291 [Elasticomyces elasticus]KAK4922576.1 hypothetical protein LTR49_010103 [Elasticomyces elasticus]KAK5760749.1 hypothetical protein LTS12_009107 [Elasticomyces elasticus]